MNRQEALKQAAEQKAQLDNLAAKEKKTDESEKVRAFIIKFCQEDYNFEALCKSYDIAPDDLNKTK
ncbi:hypothetical protein Q5H80_03060 [Vibrio sp. SNU_ST1]|uniref:hypothetical protein n=1 Tax=Vibrio sp. SNU_ST1 TaxID=3064001 RepID=UPI00272C9F22|nr:hypothetical protein [Vibrio sp. SNU_ST1]WKY58645.1 hypothetical protein Q5H80_03060 [Vibrio sp. SNU_ST1]